MEDDYLRERGFELAKGERSLEDAMPYVRLNDADNRKLMVEMRFGSDRWLVISYGQSHMDAMRCADSVTGAIRSMGMNNVDKSPRGQRIPILAEGDFSRDVALFMIEKYGGIL